MAFNAKNLAYDAKEPAFLQRLRGHYGDTSGGLERPISQRPRRPRDENEDDSPTYVDAESNEVISKEYYEALVKGDSDKQTEKSAGDVKDQEAGAEESGEQTKAETAISQQNLAEIGGPRKRKQAKVVGDELQEAEIETVRPKDSGPRKPKQKKKKIKLSFEE
ncbi:hypothetical protein BJX70DRAFT_210556 [Aspergillus crustosus]